MTEGTGTGIGTACPGRLDADEPRGTRAKERGETQGFMKVLVDAQTERILGAALLCIEGDEIVHSLLDVMAADASYQVIRRCVHIHPTRQRADSDAVGQLDAALRDGPSASRTYNERIRPPSIRMF